MLDGQACAIPQRHFVTVEDVSTFYIARAPEHLELVAMMWNCNFLFANEYINESMQADVVSDYVAVSGDITRKARFQN